MSSEFKPGDLVRHKTGGPVMCVVIPSGSDSMFGTWWAGDNFKSVPFFPYELAHHEPVDGDGIEQGEPGTFQKTDLAKYPNLWDGIAAERVKQDILAAGHTPECRNCGMWLEEHGDSNVCPTGDTVFKAEVD